MIPEDKFSATEVGALLEGLKNDIATIAERLDPLIEDVSVLKTDMSEVKNTLITIKDALRIAIPAVHTRLDKLETKVSG